MSPWVQASKPALILAPMEGVTDAPMRALFAERGGFSFCVSEFLRVTQQLLSASAFIDHLPELRTACLTPTGVPVQLQLLGGDPEWMARNAVRAVRVGATAIDLNFGCPAPTVNRNDGGATLLKYPHRIRTIVAAVRAAVPAAIPVSAKLRLGWECMDDIFRNAEEAVEGGAAWLTIHARTRMQGYAPPAHWQFVGEVRKRVSVPVVANGDIWTFEDFLRCEEVTGCRHFMIGRGALANPALPLQIARYLGLAAPEPETGNFHEPFDTSPASWEPLVQRFAELCRPYSASGGYIPRRIKQWLRFPGGGSTAPLPWFEELKRLTTADELFAALRQLSCSSKSHGPGDEETSLGGTFDRRAGRAGDALATAAFAGG